MDFKRKSNEDDKEIPNKKSKLVIDLTDDSIDCENDDISEDEVIDPFKLIIENSQIYFKNERLKVILDNLNSSKDLLNGYRHNSSIDDFNLKDHLLPTKRNVGLFTTDDLANRKKITDNFVKILNESISYQLISENDKEVINEFLNMSRELQEIYVLLFLKKNRWSLVNSINGIKDSLNLLEELKNSKFLLSSDDLSSLEESLSLLNNEEMQLCIKNCKLKNQKTKKANIISIIKFVRSVRNPIIPGATLENERLKFVKKLLKKKIYRINNEKRNVFLKVLVIYFEPVTFDKEVYHYYSNLLANLTDLTFVEKYPIYKKNQTVELYASSEDLDRFVNSCLIELNLNENNYDTLINYIIELLSVLEENLNTNYFKDCDLPDYLKKFTCIGRLSLCLGTFMRLLDTDLEWNAEDKDSIKEKLNCLINTLGFQTKNEELIEDLDRIEIKKVALDVTCDFKLRRKQEAVKNDKQVAEDIVIEIIKNETNLESALKNQSNLFDILLFNLFYDEIFDQTVENTFLYNYQKYPLDISSSSFYRNRMDQFSNKFEKFRKEKKKYLIDTLNEKRKLKCLKFITKGYTINNEAIKDLVVLFKKEDLLLIIKRLILNFNLRKNSCTNLIFYSMDDLSDREKLHLKFIELKANDDTENLDTEKDKMMKFLSSLGLNVEVYNVQNNRIS